MAKRTLRLEGDEILRKKCKPVREITPQVITLLEDMAETMKDANGVGLAAPQVGILKRIVVIDVGEGLIEMINPVILETAGSQVNEEGCLSIPGACAWVDRPDYVKVEYTDRHGVRQTLEATGFLAIAVSHETDHLEGILYIDKAMQEEPV